MSDPMADSIGDWISNGQVAENITHFVTGVLKMKILPPVIFSRHVFLGNISNYSSHHDRPPAETPTLQRAAKIFAPRTPYYSPSVSSSFSFLT